MATNTTATLSAEMIQYLEKTFLERSEARTIHAEGAKKKTLEKNSGTTVTFTKRSPFAPATTPLVEGENPQDDEIKSNKVTATLKGYGKWTKVSSMLYNTSIDREMKETVEMMGQNSGETIDALVRNVLHQGATVQFANKKSALTGITDDDILTVAEVRKAVRTLKKNNAMVYPDGYFLGKVGPDTAYNITGDTAWVDAQKYTGRPELYKGELGRLHNSNFVHGQEAFGVVDLAGSGLKKIIIKISDKGDTSNPLNQFMTVGWKAEAFASAVLDPKWIINIKTGAKD